MDLTNMTQSSAASNETVTDLHTAPGGSLEAVILVVVSLVIDIIGLVGNAFVIFIIFKTKSLRERLPNQFIMNQSIIDFCSCISLIFSVLPKKGYLTGSLADDLYCKLFLSNAFSWGLVFSSTYALIALTIERYLSIVHPVWHKTWCSKKKAWVVMGLTWLFGLVEGVAHAMPTSFVQDGVCYAFSRWPSNWARIVAGLITCTLHYIMPMAVLVFCYGKMVLVISGRIKKVTPSANHNQAPDNHIQAPANHTQTPANHSQAPANHSQAPANHTQAPANDIQAPANDIQPPANDIQAPVNHIQAPANDIQAPANDIQAPANDIQAPANDIKAPANDTQAPANDIQAPANDIQAPANHIQAPANHTQTAPGSPAKNQDKDKTNTPEVATENVAAPTKNKHDQMWSKAKRNVIHALTLVSVLFALCWSMNQVYYLMMCLGYPPDFTSTFYNITVLAIYMNSCVNPIVYFAKYDQFKRAAAGMLCGNEASTNEPSSMT